MAFWRRQPEEPKWPAAPVEGVDAFKKFYDAGTLAEVSSRSYHSRHCCCYDFNFQSLEAWQEVCSAANLPQGGRYKEFFPLLKAAYNVSFVGGIMMESVI